MEIVKTVLSLQLSEAFRPWLEIRGLIREFGGNPSSEIQGPPVLMDLKDKKQRVLLHIKAIEFEQEDVSSLEESTAVAMDLVTKGNDISEFPEVKGMWHKAVFIEPYALPFHELLNLIKHRFVSENELAESSTDVGIVFDQAEGDIVKHAQFGPMAKEQLLSQFLNWPKDNLPDNFVFLALKYDENKVFKFERKHLEKFLKEANEWEVNQAKWFFDYLRREGK
jgi:hypothetical protein